MPDVSAAQGAPEDPASPASPGTGTGTALVDQPVEQVPGTWTTMVWNDPVNLMSYVSYVFRSYFGYGKDKAEELMMQVHTDGRAVVSSGSREKMETDVTAMHRYGLWATVQRDD
ncbi:ATP-dependent Clp protease adapter ClpS [Aquipuribacter hungaricus]|uniref:ATP-dependent Clp protease adapter protein ClpS n=1 Tax=Aquipuribacter hungaricus TaxID=545624 RepID=A0ABV7WKI0_9MICO